MTIVNDTRVVRLQRTAARTGHQHSSDERIVEFTTDEIITSADVVSLPPGSLISLKRGPAQGHTEEGSILNATSDDIGGVGGGQSTSVSFDSEDAGASAAAIFVTELDFTATLTAAGEYAINYKTFQIKTYTPVPTTPGSRILVTYTWAPIREYLEWVSEDLQPDLEAFGDGPHQAGGGDAYEILEGCGIDVNIVDGYKEVSVDVLSLAGTGLGTEIGLDGCLKLKTTGGGTAVNLLEGCSIDLTEVDGYTEVSVDVSSLAGPGIETHLGDDGCLQLSLSADAIGIVEGCGVNIEPTDDGYQEISLDLQSIAGIGLVVGASGSECNVLNVDIDAYQVGYDDTANNVVFTDNVQGAIDIIDSYLHIGDLVRVRKLGSDSDNYPTNTVYNTDGNRYDMGSNRLMVWVNGIPLFEPDDYTETTPTTLTIVEAPDNTDIIDIWILPRFLGMGTGATLQQAYDNSPLKQIVADDGQITFMQPLSTGSALNLTSTISVTPSLVVDQSGTGEGARIKSVDGTKSSLLIQKDTVARNSIVNTLIVERTTSDVLGSQTGIGSSILTRLENTGTVLFPASNIVTGTEDATDSSENAYLSIELTDDGVLQEKVRVASNGNIGVGTTSPDNFIVETAGDIGPAADNMYSLGSLDVRWKDGYFGPDSVHIISKAGETPSEEIWSVIIDDDGKLAFVNNENTIVSVDDEKFITNYPIHILESTAPGPIDGYGQVYVQSDGHLYYRKSDGLQVRLSDPSGIYSGALDAYALDADLQPEIRRNDHQDTAINDILGSLDGYADGTAYTEDLDEAMRHVLVSLDGYASKSDLDGYASKSDLDGYEPESNLDERVTSIQNTLDGYALDSDLAELDAREATHNEEVLGHIKAIIDVVDGYALDDDLQPEIRRNDHQDTAINDIVESLDGYSGIPVGVLDGYALKSDLDAYEPESNLDERVTIIQNTLDGYAADGDLQSEIRRNDHQDTAINDILSDLDGYALDSELQPEIRRNDHQDTAINDILGSLDGYGGIPAGVLDGYALTTDLDAYATNDALQAQKIKQGLDTKAIIDVIDGYALDSDLQSEIRRNDHQDTALSDILSDLDGYALDSDLQPEIRRNDHQDTAINDILGSLDGYGSIPPGVLDGYALITDLDAYATNDDLQAQKTKQGLDTKAIIDVIDGYALDSDLQSEVRRNDHQDTAINDIVGSLDGYGSVPPGVLDGYALTTDLDAYATNDDLQAQKTKQGLDTKAIIDVIDGYALDSDLQPEIRRNDHQDTAINDIVSSLDGYSGIPPGVLDGYALTTDLDAYATNDDLQAQKTKQGLDTKAIIDVIDGYALDSDLQPEIRRNDHQDTALSDILSDLDGYALDSDLQPEIRRNDHQDTAINDIVGALDGYGSVPPGVLDGYALTTDLDAYASVDALENQKTKQGLDTKAIIDVIDGYALDSDLQAEVRRNDHQDTAINDILGSLDGYADGSAYTEDLDEAMRHVLDSLDGYALDSELQSQKTKQGLDTKAIIDVIDGYALDSDLQPEIRRNDHQDTAINTILSDLDGYIGQTPGFTGSDGQVAFFTGSSQVSGNDDLFWNNTDKRLGIGTDTPQVPFQIISPDVDGYNDVEPSAWLRTNSGRGNLIGLGSGSSYPSILMGDAGSNEFFITSKAYYDADTYKWRRLDDATAGIIRFKRGVFMIQTKDGDANFGDPITGNNPLTTFKVNDDGAVGIGTLEESSQVNISSSRIGNTTDAAIRVRTTIDRGNYIAFSSSPSSYIGLEGGGHSFWASRAYYDTTDYKYRRTGTDAVVVTRMMATGSFIVQAKEEDLGASQGDELSLDTIFQADVSGAVSFGTLETDGQLNIVSSRVDNNPHGAIKVRTDDGVGNMMRMYNSSMLGVRYGYAFFTKGLYWDTDVNTYRRLNTGDHGSAFELVNDGTLIYSTLSSTGSEGDAVTPTEVFRITRAGDVGLGVFPPTEKLDVDGNIKVSGNIQNTELQNILDGYALDLDLQPEIRRNDHQDTAINTILGELDGYGAGVEQTPGFTGADGYVTFFTGNNQIAGDNDLYWDRANNRLGIHNTSPSASLDVNGSVAIANPYGDSKNAALTFTGARQLIELGTNRYIGLGPGGLMYQSLGLYYDSSLGRYRRSADNTNCTLVEQQDDDWFFRGVNESGNEDDVLTEEWEDGYLYPIIRINATNRTFSMGTEDIKGTVTIHNINTGNTKSAGIALSGSTQRIALTENEDRYIGIGPGGRMYQSYGLYYDTVAGYYRRSYDSNGSDNYYSVIEQQQNNWYFKGLSTAGSEEDIVKDTIEGGDLTTILRINTVSKYISMGTAGSSGTFTVVNSWSGDTKYSALAFDDNDGGFIRMGSSGQRYMGVGPDGVFTTNGFYYDNDQNYYRWAKTGSSGAAFAVSHDSFTFKTAPSGTDGDEVTNLSTLVTINNTGIGIGVSPTEALDVVGNIKVSGNIKNTELQNILDGYALDSDLQPEIRRNDHQDTAIGDILGSLDGYGGSVSQAPGFTGADGYITFFTGDNQIAGDNDFFWDRANNRVGVGTSTPQGKLQVESHYGTELNIAFSQNSSHDNNDIFAALNFYTPDGDNSSGAQNIVGFIRSVHTRSGTGHAWEDAGLTFGTLNTTDSVTERMRITHDGNVGIGTETPDGLLHINGTNPYLYVEGSQGATIALGRGDNTQAGILIFATGDPATAGNRDWNVGLRTSGTSDFSFWNKNTNNTVLRLTDDAPDTSMVLDADGVGIGTSGSGITSQVNILSDKTGNTRYAGLDINTSGGEGNYIRFGSGNKYIIGADAGSVFFTTQLYYDTGTSQFRHAGTLAGSALQIANTGFLFKGAGAGVDGDPATLDTLMSVNNDGYVSIGTTDTTGKLTVFGSKAGDTTDPTLLLTAPGGDGNHIKLGSGLKYIGVGDSGNIFMSSGLYRDGAADTYRRGHTGESNVFEVSSSASGFIFKTVSPGGSIGDSVVPTTAVIIKNSGDMGIGTDSPSERLEVDGNIKISGNIQNTELQNILDGYALASVEDQRWIDSTQQRQDIRDALDGYGDVSQESGFTGVSGYVTFFTGDQEISGDSQFFWDNSAKELGIGGVSSPRGKVHIRSSDAGIPFPTTQGDTLVIEKNDNAGITIFAPNDKNSSVFFGDTESSSEGYIQYQHNLERMVFGSGGSVRMYLDDAGTLSIGASQFGASDPSKLFVYENSDGYDGIGALRISGSPNMIELESGRFIGTSHGGRIFMGNNLYYDSSVGDYRRVSSSAVSWMEIHPTQMYWKSVDAGGSAGDEITEAEHDTIFRINTVTKEFSVNTSNHPGTFNINGLGSDDVPCLAFEGNPNRIRLDIGRYTGIGAGGRVFHTNNAYYDSGNYIASATGSAKIFEIGVDRFRFKYHDSVTADVSFVPSTMMTIMSTGVHVGFGDQDANEALTVDGVISIEASAGPSSTDTNYGKLYVNSSDDHLYFQDESGTDYDLLGSVSQTPGFTGADGYVAFFTGDGQIAGDNDFFWDRANNRVGVGTSLPQSKVGIKGNMTIGSSYAETQAAASDSLLVEGKVSIGTTKNTFQLHVDGSATGAGIIYVEGAGSGTVQSAIVLDSSVPGRGAGMHMYNSDDQAEWFAGRPYGAGGVNSSDNFIIGRLGGQTYYSGGSAQKSNSFLLIDNSGNVGLGTDTPTEVLDVIGNLKVSGHIANHILQTALDAYGAGVEQTPGFTGADGYVAFFTGDNQIAGDNDLYWDRAGNNLGVGISNPSSKVHIRSPYTGNTPESALQVTTDNGKGNFIKFGEDSDRMYMGHQGSNWLFMSNGAYYDGVAYGYRRIGTSAVGALEIRPQGALHFQTEASGGSDGENLGAMSTAFQVKVDATTSINTTSTASQLNINSTRVGNTVEAAIRMYTSEGGTSAGNYIAYGQTPGAYHGLTSGGHIFLANKAYLDNQSFVWRRTGTSVVTVAEVMATGMFRVQTADEDLGASQGDEVTGLLTTFQVDKTGAVSIGTGSVASQLNIVSSRVDDTQYAGISVQTDVGRGNLIRLYNNSYIGIRDGGSIFVSKNVYFDTDANTYRYSQTGSNVCVLDIANGEFSIQTAVSGTEGVGVSPSTVFNVDVSGNTEVSGNISIDGDIINPLLQNTLDGYALDSDLQPEIRRNDHQDTAISDILGDLDGYALDGDFQSESRRNDHQDEAINDILSDLDGYALDSDLQPEIRRNDHQDTALSDILSDLDGYGDVSQESGFTGVSGYAAFFTGDKEIAGDSQFYWDNSSKRLGVGASPSYKLDVREDNTGTFIIRTRADSVDNSSGFYQDGSKNVRLYLRDGTGSDGVLLNPAGNSYLTGGNLAIGATSPSAVLDARVAGPSAWIIKARDTIVDNSSGLYQNASKNMQLILADSNSDNKVSLRTDGNSYLTGGSLGVGTNSPSAVLDVRVAGPSGWIIKVRDTTIDNSSGFYQDASNNLQLILADSNGDNKVSLRADGNSFLDGGNLAIGKTSASEALDVEGNIKVSGNIQNTELQNILDGYALDSDLQSESRRNDHQDTALGDILGDLDGYALASVENQRWIDSSQQRQDIRDALDDGYVQETPGFTGADGYIAFFTGDNRIAGDNDFFWDRAGNRVGVGTSLPQSKIGVKGNMTIGGSYAETQAAPSDGLLVEGKVGIGTSSLHSNAQFELDSNHPNGETELHITGDGNGFHNAALVLRITYDASRGAGTYMHNEADDVEWFSGRPYTANASLNYSDNFIISRQSSVANHITSTNNITNALFVVNNSGNIGIGTTDPQNKLDVGGGSVIGALYSGNETAPSDGLLVEGKVGIGTTSLHSNAQLEIDSSLSSGETELHITGDGNGFHNAAVILRASYDASRGAGIYMHNDVDDVEWFSGRPYAASAGLNYSDNFIISRKSSITDHDTSVNNITNALFVVDNSGNAGIGTNSPSERLDVDGNIKVSGNIQNTELQNILDGYALDSDFQSEVRRNDHQDTALGDILSDLDGYALASVENQRWIDSSQQRQDIRDALDDGYIQQTTGFTGTNGYVAFFTGDNRLSGESDFFWDSANKRVGIGKSTPNAQLEIYNSSANATSYMYSVNNNSNFIMGRGSTSRFSNIILATGDPSSSANWDWVIGTRNNASDINFYDGLTTDIPVLFKQGAPANSLVVTSTGVGIGGVANPSAASLDVAVLAGAAETDAAIKLRNGNNLIMLDSGRYIGIRGGGSVFQSWGAYADGSDWKRTGSNAGTIIEQSGTDWYYMKFDSGGVAGDIITPTTIMRMDAANRRMTLNTANNTGTFTINGSETGDTDMAVLAFEGNVNRILLGSARYIGIATGGRTFHGFGVSYDNVGGTYVRRHGGAVTSLEQNADGLYFNYAGTGTSGDPVTLTTAVTINSTGIGIGTAPSEALDVDGNIKVSGNIQNTELQNILDGYALDADLQPEIRRNDHQDTAISDILGDLDGYAIDSEFQSESRRNDHQDTAISDILGDLDGYALDNDLQPEIRRNDHQDEAISDIIDSLDGYSDPVYTITPAKTGAYSANVGEVVRCDPSGGGFTITLPPANSGPGETVVVKNTTSSTNTITIDGDGSETIDGQSSITIEEGYKSFTLVSYGSEWGII